MIIRSEVSPQTVNYLDEVFGFRQVLEKKVEEKILFPKLNQRLSKLSYFMEKQNREELKQIVKKVFILDK